MGGTLELPEVSPRAMDLDRPWQRLPTAALLEAEQILLDPLRRYKVWRKVRCASSSLLLRMQVPVQAYHLPTYAFLLCFPCRSQPTNTARCQTV